MRLKELRRMLAALPNPDAEVLVWCRHAQMNVAVEQVTFSADRGTVYVQGEFIEWNEETKTWQ